MHPFIRKTLGGLTPQYYFRQLFFGLIVAVFAFFMLKQGGAPSTNFGIIIWYYQYVDLSLLSLRL